MSDHYEEEDLSYPAARRTILECIEAFASRETHLRKWMRPTDYDSLHETWAYLTDGFNAVGEDNARLIGDSLRNDEEARALRTLGERFHALAATVGVGSHERPDLYLTHAGWNQVVKAARVALAKMTDGSMDPWHKPIGPSG